MDVVQRATKSALSMSHDTTVVNLGGAVYKTIQCVDAQGSGLKARRALSVNTVLEDSGPVWVDGEPPCNDVGVSEEYVMGRGGYFRLRVMGELVLSYFINEARGDNLANVEWRANCSHGRFRLVVIRPIDAGEELLVKYA